jgi:hypothetical protein
MYYKTLRIYNVFIMDILFTKLVCLPKREGADYGKDTSLLYIFLALCICLIIHYQNVF